jgi:molybdopterin synthase sulfur carrier subunit
MMPVLVRIPTPLRSITKGAGETYAKGETVAELLEDLERQHPGLRERIVDEGGEVRRFINIYVNEEDIRFLKGKDTALKDGDEVSIVPAIAGGRSPHPTLSPCRGEE